MQTDITTDMLHPGDRLAPLELELTGEFNESIVQSVGADLSRYSGSGEQPGHRASGVAHSVQQSDS